MAEDHVLDLLPGYALGVLDEEDLIAVAKHLPGCARCRAELALYHETAGQLAQAVPLVDPPSDLRARVVVRAVERSRANSGLPSAPANRLTLADVLRGWLPRRAGWVVAGLGLALLLFLGLSNLLLSRQVNELQARLPGDDMQLVQLTGTDNAPLAVGYLMVFKNDHYGALAIDEAPMLDADHQYQVWLIRDGQRTSGGVFSVNEEGYGTLQISADQPLDSYQSFGITVEPRGGSPAPTGQKILGGDL